MKGAWKIFVAITSSKRLRAPGTFVLEKTLGFVWRHPRAIVYSMRSFLDNELLIRNAINPEEIVSYAALSILSDTGIP